MTACRSGAIGTAADGRAEFSEDICRHCGLCLGKCPFGAFPKEKTTRFLITVGGTWGKIRRDGTSLSCTVDEASIGDAVETILLWYRKHGYIGERLGATIDRVGMASLEAAILDGSLLSLREEILAAPLTPRPEVKE